MSFSKRARAVTPSSDAGDILQTESEQSGQHFSNGSHGSHKDTLSSAGIKAISDGHMFVNPNNFASLQKYLCSTGKEYSSTDLMNLSVKDDLEASLKEYISVDILDEHNKFSCDTCEARTLGEMLVLLLLFHPCCLYLGPYAGSLVNRQVLIKKLPPILILNIKRFAMGGYALRKNDDYLSFPHILNMGPYCTDACFQVCIFCVCVCVCACAYVSVCVCVYVSVRA